MKHILKLIFLLILCCAITSCDLPWGDDVTETEEWGCLINSDGTGFECFMRGPTSAIFTQDNQKIVYKTSEGIFTRDFGGNINQISDVAVNEYDLISPSLDYLISEENNDIYRMNIDGSDKINLTKSPDYRDFNSSFSSAGNMITFVSEFDNIYSICSMNIAGEDKIEISLDDVTGYAYPKLNTFNNEIFYVANTTSIHDRALKSISLPDLEIKLISDSLLSYHDISGYGNKVVYVKTDHMDIDHLMSYDTLTYETTTIITNYKTSGRFSIDYKGTKIVVYESLVSVIDLNSLEYINVSNGYNAVISPDGEKIFFISERKLPIED